VITRVEFSEKNKSNEYTIFCRIVQNLHQKNHLDHRVKSTIENRKEDRGIKLFYKCSFLNIENYSEIF
jgi:hypothetical protein